MLSSPLLLPVGTIHLCPKPIPTQSFFTTAFAVSAIDWSNSY